MSGRLGPRLTEQTLQVRKLLRHTDLLIGPEAT